MKTIILLCAGLLTMGMTTTLNPDRVMAIDVTQSEHRPVPKKAIVSEKNAEYYKRSGDVKSDSGDYQGAITDYTRAIEINPKFKNAHNNRGIAKSELGYYSDAIDDYTRAIEINPKNDKAYHNRGNTKFDLGDYQGAIADYNRAVEINPKNEAAIENLTIARQREERRVLEYINRVRNNPH